MIVPFMDSMAGTAVCVNLTYVVTLRPDPDEPMRISLVKLKDAESVHVIGDHREVADKLARNP